MTDRMSQAEIDALIAQMTSAENETAAAVTAPVLPDPGTSLSQSEIDALFAGATGPESAPPSPDPARCDLGPIAQTEVDALVLAAQAKKATGAAPRSPAAAAGPRPASMPTGNSSVLMEIALDLTVELGRARMPLKQVLGLAPGSVITLEHHLASDPVVVLINQTPVMKAEVVVIGENYGIRITQSSVQRRLPS